MTANVTSPSNGYPINRPKERLTYLDIGKGIATVLVVIGHIVGRGAAPGPNWFGKMVGLIYLFHMPVFMVLAGITFEMSLKRFSGWPEVVNFSWRKVSRLILPYLAFGALIILGKYFVADLLHVDNVPTSLPLDLLNLIFQPGATATSFLWFIYVLGIYYLVIPPMRYAVRMQPEWLLGAGVLAHLISWPTLFSLDVATWYLSFLAAGMLIWRHHNVILPPIIKHSWLWIGSFAVILFIALPLDLPKWLVGTASVPAVLTLSYRAKGWIAQFFAYIGRFSLSIYLMNTLAIGVTKAL